MSTYSPEMNQWTSDLFKHLCKSNPGPYPSQQAVTVECKIISLWDTTSIIEDQRMVC